MKIRFLGTNGWYNTHIANTTCIFIETGEFYLVLDAGDGFYKVGRFIKQRKPIYLFLSHFHLDHISGLHTLNKFTFPQGLKIYGYKGMSRILNRVICSPYTVPFSELSYPVELLEIEEGRHNSPFPFTSLFLLHSVACFGYRLEIEGKTIAYCPDTGVCENALRLSENADLLLCECSLRTGEFKEEWPHLNPHTAAQIAQRSKAKQLILIHFNPYLYPELADREEASRRAREVFANVFYAQDEQEVEV